MNLSEERMPTQLEQQSGMMAAVKASESYAIHTYNSYQMGVSPADENINRELFKTNMGLCGYQCVKEWEPVSLRLDFCNKNWIDSGKGKACVWSEIGGTRRVYCLFFYDSNGDETLMVSPTPIDGINLPKVGPRLGASYTTQCSNCGLMRLG